MIVGIMQHPSSAAAHPPLDHHPNKEQQIEEVAEVVENSNNSSNELRVPEETGYMQTQHPVSNNSSNTHMMHPATTMNGHPPMPPPPHNQIYVDPHTQHHHHTINHNNTMMNHHPHHHHHHHHPGMMAAAGTTGLEQQFNQFGIHDPHHAAHSSGDQLGSSAHNTDSSDNNDTEHTGNEGDDSEEEPVKLFVGQVPKAMNEEDIFPTFDGFGPLKDVAVIRDKHTGIHRGCAFVTYWNSADAERAREALHDKFTFPGAKRPAQVKPAEPTGPPENKLFVGMLSRTAGEEEVRTMFSQFGEIREVHMIRNADGSSKCAAFLRFVNRDSAVMAIEQLNGVEVMEGAQRPLIVKFADNKQQRHQRHMRQVRRHDMMAMAGPAGYPYAQAPPPPHMGMHPGAAPQYPMPPQGYPTAAYPHGPHAPPYMYPPPYGPPYPYQQPRPERRPSNQRPREGPAGANLFVYHLPHDLTDADLATAFNPFGNVISAKVYVDRFTGESKGFGFVSYDSVIAAENAIEQMNGFQIGNKRLKVQHKRVHGSGNNSQAPSQRNSPPMPDEGDEQEETATG